MLMAKTKVLLVSANPDSTGRLALDSEVREIDQKIQSSNDRDSLELITKWATRPRDLLEHLNRHRPHIVHFSGHGSPYEEIILVNESGAAQPVSRDALVGLFKTLKDNIKIVVLNACYSAVQAEAITRQIDCSIGMSKAIGDRAAIVFASTFYSALGFGRSVQEAFDQGRVALMLENIPEENTPVLHVRDGVDAGTMFLSSNGHDAPVPISYQGATYPAQSTVLIVEDDGSIQALLGSLLRREGYSVVAAGTAAAAISELKSRRIDLVLLDQELPDGNGMEVAAEMRAWSQAKVIFLTQRATSEAKLAGFGIGAEDYVTKPFDPEELLARIKNVLRRSSAAPIR